MKVKNLGVLLGASLTFLACDDTTNTLGLDMLPPSDAVAAHTMTFDVTTQSVAADAVYAKTAIGYVGKFTDPEFGDYTASFLTELNCTEDFKFSDILPEVYEEYYDGDTLKGKGTLVDEKVAGVRLLVYYNDWFGDSLNACRMSVYELNDQWIRERHDENRQYRYTNLDAEKYKGRLLGRKAYTAYDASVPDSIRYATDSNGNLTYYPTLIFDLDTEIGENILELNRAYERGENNFFDDADHFIDNVFKGVYVKSDFGDGTILYVDRVDLEFQFRFHYVDSLGVALKKKVNDVNGNIGDDSIYIGRQPLFASTKEVIQANQFANSERLTAKVNEKEWTYIKSPAGIFTEAILPYDEIYQQLSNDTLNAVKLTFTNYEDRSSQTFSMGAPTNVLLIRKQDVKTFFEENQINDNRTSFVATHNSNAVNQYHFPNIARLVTACINEKKAARAKAEKEAGTSWNEEAWDAQWSAENPDWNRVWLIPVTITTQQTSSSTSVTTAIQHDLQPGYAKLQGGDPEQGGQKLTLEVTYTSFPE